MQKKSSKTVSQANQENDVNYPMETGKSTKKGPTKSQINRLKKFYNTTRWLPNSAFTTYFGKPAFENYGYGNTNPVYGGLFYGNYMLSHNMNPIDGANHPAEKQVYSSAMMKSSQRKCLRRPSPPRKVPDEIRNTPEELEEIKTRKQIFQLPNNFPTRDIVPPNLLKCQYFRSGKNTPENSEDEENEDEYEVWNVENILSGKKNKVKKIDSKKNSNYNPFQDGKVQLGKKKMKEEIDNKIDPELYKKMKEKKRKKGMEMSDEEKEAEEIDVEYEKQKNFYEKILGEDGMKNIEDLTNIKLEEENQQREELRNDLNNTNNINNNQINQDFQYQTGNIEEGICPHCNQNMGETAKSYSAMYNSLRKKENPALLPPENNPAFICCVHHSKEMFDATKKDPRLYKDMPPCMMKQLVSAGLPTKKQQPLNLFA